jgi:hypothetical protein
MTSLVSYSQTLSKTQDKCLVPCQAVRNALILNEKHTLVLSELSLKSDSLRILNDIVIKKDEIILNQNQTIELKDKYIVNYESIVQEKDVQIKVYKDEIKKHKTQKFVAWGITATSIIVSIVMIL